MTAFSSNSHVLWDAPTGGFIHRGAAGDLDGDGLEEIAAASADGFVSLFDARRRCLWKTADEVSAYDRIS